MDSGYWSAVSGSDAREQQLEIIANNMANINTAGFKKDGVDFHTFIKNRDNPDPSNSVPRDLLALKQQYPLDGNESVGVVTKKTYTDQSQGALEKTDDPFHLAINGPGFFQVLAPDGIKLSRAGNFQIRRDGLLCTIHGYPVLKEGSSEQFDYNGILNSRAVRVDGRFSVGGDGTVNIGGANQGKLALVLPANNDLLQKVGLSLYETKSPLAVAPGSISQGFLEKSNVNAVQELSEMLRVNRAFEAGQKVIKTFDALNSRSVNEISKIN